MTRRNWIVALALMVAMPAGAQVLADGMAVADHVAAGDRAHTALDATAALEHYERALSLDPTHYEALWKASRDAVDLGEFMADRKRRSEYYRRAEGYARRAVAANPADAEAHFHLARAVGVAALALGVRDRVKYANEVRAEALRALELNPKHPGALHVMGMWNAEVMRLSGFERSIARTFLGGRVFGSASWADAIRYMEEAVAVDPGRLTHHLDLARIYRDRGEKAKAREQYEAVIRGTASEFNDAEYKRLAERELAAIR
jgi:tetratricopeptide (TPR) repeat protein